MKKIVIYIAIFSFMVISCSKEDQVDYSNIAIYGHGGNGFQSVTNPIPANSFSSIQKAVEVQNADGIEVDVQIDKEGKLWLYHDEILDTKTNCAGCIGDLSSSDISSCSYWNNRKVYSLTELIQYLSKLNPIPKVSLQAQVFNRCESYENLGCSIFSLIESYNAYSWIQVESDSKELLVLLKDSSDQFQLFIDEKNAQDAITTCLKFGFNGFMIDNKNVSSEEINSAKTNGLIVGIFGVNNQSNIKRALNKFPHQLQTDNIELTNRIMSD